MYYNRSKILIIFFVFAMIIITSGLNGREKWKVGVKPAAPFVMVDKNKNLSGFSIDLIKAIAKNIDPDPNFQPEFHIDPDLKSHFESIISGKVNLGIAATTVTPEREKKMDFSQPFFKGGLGILVLAGSKKTSALSVIFSKDLLPILVGLIAYILFVAIIIWLLERKQGTFKSNFSSGIGEGIWWTVVTMSTVGYGDYKLSRPISRVIGIFVIFSGIILFGVAIGTFSSAMTLNKLKAEINGPQDLIKKKVASVKGSTGSREMDDRGVEVKEYTTLDQCIDALIAKNVSAVVYDMPQLRYQVKVREKDKLEIAGNLFKPEDYGIVFPLGGDLRKEINIRLLKLKEDKSSIYYELKKNYFGSKK